MKTSEHVSVYHALLTEICLCILALVFIAGLVTSLLGSMSVKAIAPFIRTVRSCSIKSPVKSDAKKFIGQTPSSFVHDGWANARTPFSVTNRWLFTVKAVVFLAIPFWAPFMVVEYQLKKANHQ